MIVLSEDAAIDHLAKSGTTVMESPGLRIGVAFDRLADSIGATPSALLVFALVATAVLGCRQAVGASGHERGVAGNSSVRDAGEEKQNTGYVASCSELPPRLPTDLTIQYHVYDYRRPDALARFVLYDGHGSCPPDDMPAHLLTFYGKRRCVPLRAPAVGQLFNELRRGGIDRIRTRALQPGPHSAGRLITLKWNHRQCSVGDVLGIMEVALEQREMLFKVSEAVATAVRSSAR
jgi:hypothetical protein